MLVALSPAVRAQMASSLSWSTYLPGNLADVVRAVVTDSAGNVWIAGSSSSVFDFPGPNDPYQSQPKGGKEVFLAKYRPEADGRATLLYWTWLGGSTDDDVVGIALDRFGRVCLAGTTDSPDFALAGNAFQNTNAGKIDTWVVVIDPAASGTESLVYGSYFGGVENETATAMALDGSGAIVVVGYTDSGELPGAGAGVQPGGQGGWETFVIRVVVDSQQTLQYSSYFGGSSTDVPTAVDVDRDGIIWFTGYTASDNIPLTSGAYRSQLSSYVDGFVAAINPQIPGLGGHVYGSYFGGNERDEPRRLVFDSDGSLWIGGLTFSRNLPVTEGAVQSIAGPQGDVFLIRLDPRRFGDQTLTYATYLGGGSYDSLYALALLGNGRVAVSGYAMAGLFPTTENAIQRLPKSQFAEGFVAIVDSRVAGEPGLEYSTYLGGSFNDVVTSLARDPSGSLFMAGYTMSSDFPVTDGSVRQNPPALPGAFAGRLVVSGRTP
jgi:hypothetical protein